MGTTGRPTAPVPPLSHEPQACLYATIMGAPLLMLRHPEKNSIYGALVEELGDDDAFRLLSDVHDELRPLKGEVDAWHEWLVASATCHHVMPKRKRRWLTNACGMTLCLDDEKPRDRKRRAAAFILQGHEAAFIHRLTLLGDQNSFVPVSNQHDGLVTLGKIPEAACTEAAKQSGLKYAFLDEKPTFGVKLAGAA